MNKKVIYILISVIALAIAIITPVILFKKNDTKEIVKKAAEEIEKREKAGSSDADIDDTDTSDSEDDKSDASDPKDDKSDSNNSDNADKTDSTQSDSDKEASSDDINSNRPNADTGKGEPNILHEGDIAPDFTAELVGGGTFKMSDYDDKIVLLNFWATWCGPCVGEMPAFERLKNDGIENLEIICINDMEDKQSVDSFVSQEGYTFNIGYDVAGKIGSYYPTAGIPYTLVIDHGKIEKIYLGADNADVQYKEYKSAIEECQNN